MSQSNDSGLNLDHLEARTQNMELVIARLEQIAEGCDDASARADEALVCARAALANQPAPTVPAGDAREAFEAWHRSKFATKHSTGQPTRDMHNGIYAEKYGPENQQQMWEVWQAALSHQPAQEQADDGMFSKEWKTGYSVGFEAAKALFSQQEPVAALGSIPLLTGGSMRREARFGGEGHVWLLYGTEGELIRALSPNEFEILESVLAAQLDGGQEGSDHA